LKILATPFLTIIKGLTALPVSVKILISLYLTFHEIDVKILINAFLLYAFKIRIILIGSSVIPYQVLFIKTFVIFLSKGKL
jgi:hypothetical protein